jgi:hypothetical protein
MATDDPDPIPTWTRLIALLEPLYRRRPKSPEEPDRRAEPRVPDAP